MRKAIPLLVILTIIWGTTWPLIPIALREVSVWTFRSVSLLGGGLALLAIARLRGESLRIPRAHWEIIATGSLVYLAFWNIASSYAALLIPSGQAAILGFTMPLWAALLAWVFIGQRPGARVLAALGIGGIGVLLLILEGISAYAKAPLGFALGLLSGVGWAVGTLILQRRPVPGSPLVVTGWHLLAAAVPVVTMAFILRDGGWFMPSTTTVLLIGYMTLVPVAIGNATWFAIVGLLPANIAGLSSVMVPVVAMVSGAIILREPLGPVQLLAMACCTAGVALALQRPRTAR